MVEITDSKTAKLMVKWPERSYGLYELKSARTRIMNWREIFIEKVHYSFAECDVCLESRASQEPRNLASSEERGNLLPLALDYTNVCEPVAIPSVGGARFLFTLCDDTSAISAGRLVKTKDETSVFF